MARMLYDESFLLALADGLGAGSVRGWSAAERGLVGDLPAVSAESVADVRKRIRAGDDPLGEWFCSVRSPRQRRESGATYTPPEIVRAMVTWSAEQATPARVVDPGAGSGRFLVAAGRRFPSAGLVAVELDPVASVLCRGHLAAAGLADRATVRQADYRDIELPPAAGPTLFLGNPPYVRHHGIGAAWKRWLAREARRRGLHPSRLAGLHVHFFLATARLARPGDLACFITSAEWLDVNYGRMVRELLLNGLGGQRLVLIEPTADPFPDAQTTGVITCMKVGATDGGMTFRRVADSGELASLAGGRPVSRRRLESTARWSGLSRRPRSADSGLVELGELCRVHRGQVTGANRIWIAGPHSEGLPPSVLLPAVTKARELYAACPELTDASSLRRVIDLPAELDELPPAERRRVEAFLDHARSEGADAGYIARHRSPWWSVRLREPAPILATYMARRPPAFVVNSAAARHLNIAHGLYPREHLDDAAIRALAAWLNGHVSLADGRTYAGGLTKFEPREMERLLVPQPAAMVAGMSS